MLRILHTADVHLGAKFTFLGDKGPVQRERLYATFKEVVQLAVDHKVSLFLVAGDLFDDNRQSWRNIELVKEQLNKLAENGIRACLLPGTHDYLDTNSIYRKTNFAQECPNTKVFDSPGLSFEEFGDLGVTVYGKPNVSNRSHESPLEGLKPATSSRYHIALAHGSLMIPGRVSEDDHVFQAEQIEKSSMDYIALGHWHRSYELPTTRACAWYSGAPEWLSSDQKDTGSVLLVEIPDRGRPKVTPLKTGQSQFEEVEIDLSEDVDVSAVKARIASGASPDLIRQVVLKGLRRLDMQLDIEEWQSELASNFFFLKIVDTSHPELHEIIDENYPEGSVIRRFVNLMQQEIGQREGKEREIAERALQRGIALLTGRDILG